MHHFEAGRRVVEMDDDIDRIDVTTGTARSDKNARLRAVPACNLERLLDHIWDVADRHGCKLWGVYPTRNVYFLSRSYTLGMAKSTGQMQGYYNPGEKMRLTLPVMEDYERVLLFYSQGFPCIRRAMTSA